MSTRINGPLVRDDERRFGYEYDAPCVECPDCGQPLRVLSAMFYGGIVSGVTWVLICVRDDATFTFQTATDFHDEAYTNGERFTR